MLQQLLKNLEIFHKTAQKESVLIGFTGLFALIMYVYRDIRKQQLTS